MLERVRLPITGVPGVVGAVASLVKAARIEVIGPAGKLQVSCVRAQTPFQPSKSEPSSGFGGQRDRPAEAVAGVAHGAAIEPRGGDAAAAVAGLAQLELDADRRRQLTAEERSRTARPPRWARPRRRSCRSARSSARRGSSLSGSSPRTPSPASASARRAFAAGTRGRTARRSSSCPGQDWPAGLDVTVAPPAFPENFTPSISGEKTATMDVRSSSTLTVHELLVPQSGSLQPEKLLPGPASAVAVSRTDVPRSYVQSQSLSES